MTLAFCLDVKSLVYLAQQERLTYKTEISVTVVKMVAWNVNNNVVNMWMSGGLMLCPGFYCRPSLSYGVFIYRMSLVIRFIYFDIP